MPGVAKKPFNSLGSVIILVIVRSFRSVNFPHLEFKQSFISRRFAALNLIHSLSNLMPSLCLNEST